MMPTCYSRDELKRFILGRLPDSTLDEISIHLDQCNTCEDTVVGLEKTTDTLVTHIQQKIESDSASQVKNEPYLTNAINELLERPSPHFNSSAPPQSGYGKLDRLGVYKILEPLASGGMGTVYLAEHAKLGKRVALKVLHHRRMHDAEFIRRFEREMKIVGGLSHPALVNATDAGEFEEIRYLAMDFVDGIDLGGIARSCERIPIADACELTRQAALGLDYVHQQGVLHRDVKPSNLMLGSDGNVKILDLGLATLSGWNNVDDLTTLGQLLGTLDYMAPEQADQESQADERSDIYGLAATLYKLLSGMAPYQNPKIQTALQKLRVLAIQSPVPIQQRVADLPVDLAKIIDQSLSSDPADRPRSAAELANALEPFSMSADLKQLLKKAQKNKASFAQNDRLEKREANLPFTESSLNRQAILPTSTQKIPPAQTSNQPASQRTGWSWTSLSIGLALFGFAAWASITIYLQTQQGTLVIESEIDDISVSIVENGETEKDLRLEHDVESTKLYAGNYRIKIQGNTDGLKIENGMFVLKRGETVVTKIRRISSKNPNSAHPIVSPPGNVNANSVTVKAPKKRQQNQPKFGGKSLDTYVEIAIRGGRKGLLKYGYGPLRLLAKKSSESEVQRLLDLSLSNLDGELDRNTYRNILSPCFNIAKTDNQFSQVGERFYRFSLDSIGTNALFRNSLFGDICLEAGKSNPQRAYRMFTTKLNSDDEFDIVFGLIGISQAKIQNEFDASQNKAYLNQLKRFTTVSLNDKNIEIRIKEHSLTRLFAFYRDAPETLAASLAYLNASNSGLQQIAIEQLTKLQPGYDELVEICLDRAQKDPSRFMDLYKLILDNPAAVEAIGKLLADKEWGIYTRFRSSRRGGALLGGSGGLSSSGNMYGLVGGGAGMDRVDAPTTKLAKKKKVAANISVRGVLLDGLYNLARKGPESREKLMPLVPILEKAAEADEYYKRLTLKTYSRISGRSISPSR